MRAAACVGRIGGLAVALGIGVATGGAGVAWADPADSDVSASADSSAAKEANQAGAPARSRGNRASRSVVDGADDHAARGAVSAPRLADVTVDRPKSGAATGSALGAERVVSSLVPRPARAVATRRVGLPRVAAASAVAEPVVAQPVMDVVASSTGLAASADSPVMVATPAQPAAAGAAESVWSPTSGSNPGAPVQSAVSWVMVAAARRELGSSPAAQIIPGAVVTTSELPDAEAVSKAAELTRTVARPAAALAAPTGSAQALTPVAAATAADPITAFIGQIQAFVTQIVQAINQVVNQVVQAVAQVVTAIINVFAPTPRPINTAPLAGSPTVGTPDPASGVVTGKINATDPNGDTLTYSGPTATAKGVVTVNSDTGAFTYAPTTTARNSAAADGATATDKSDAFTVTVTDSNGASTTIPVNVVISPTPQTDPGPQPTNRAPVAGTPVVGTPNASTGVVTGSVTATDPDNDPLTYSGSTTTSKGSVTVAANGTFTYTPTATARHAAAQTGATTATTTDSFTVTVADGKGGTATVPVTVTISPVNAAPVAGTSTVGTPNASTGVVTGTVSATDANNDTLTYSTPATTGKGSVSINASTGNFTYTPTATARNTAANTGATSADRADTFTVTVADSYGSSTAIPVNVVVSPTPQQVNRAPVAGTPTVGIPNASTGVVTGQINATDPEGDTLTYSAPATTPKGSVAINAATGAFTYTPTLTARHAAAVPEATAETKSDTFAVTVTDSYGATASIPVTLAIGATATPIIGDIRMQPDGLSRAMYAPRVSVGYNWIGVDPTNGGMWLTDSAVNSWLDVTPPTGAETNGGGTYSPGDIKVPPGTVAGAVTLFAVKTGSPANGVYDWAACSTTNACGSVSGLGTYGPPVPVAYWVDLYRANPPGAQE